MPEPFEGGCACGAVRYRCTADAARVYYCHCRDCQRATGTAFHTGLSVPRNSVAMLAGEPREYSRLADSGNTVTEGFCATCGSPLYVYSTGRPGHMSLKAGALDDPSALAPKIQIWTASAVPWSDTGGADQRYPRGMGSSDNVKQ